MTPPPSWCRPHWGALVNTPVPRCGWLLAPMPRAEGVGHSRMPSEQRPLSENVRRQLLRPHCTQARYRGKSTRLGRCCPCSYVTVADIQRFLWLAMPFTQPAPIFLHLANHSLCRVRLVVGTPSAMNQVWSRLQRIESGWGEQRWCRNRLSQVRHDWCQPLVCLQI